MHAKRCMLHETSKMVVQHNTQKHNQLPHCLFHRNVTLTLFFSFTATCAPFIVSSVQGSQSFMRFKKHSSQRVGGGVGGWGTLLQSASMSLHLPILIGLSKCTQSLSIPTRVPDKNYLSHAFSGTFCCSLQRLWPSSCQ